MEENLSMMKYNQSMMEDKQHIMEDNRQLLDEAELEVDQTMENIEQIMNDYQKLNDSHYPCDECGKTFSGKEKLTGHKSYTHRIEVSMCSICGNEFQNKQKLQKHINARHNDKGLPCDMCTKVFKNNSDLYGHKKKVHEETENLLCPSCGTKKTNIFKLKRHMRKSCRGYVPTTDNLNFIKEVKPKFKEAIRRNKDNYSTDLSDYQKKRSDLVKKWKEMEREQNERNKTQKNENKNDIQKLTKTIRRKCEIKNVNKNIKLEALKLKSFPSANNENYIEPTVELFNNKQGNECIECGKSFSKGKLLNGHIKLVHKYEPCFCPFCGIKSLKNKTDLSKHIKKDHQDYRLPNEEHTQDHKLPKEEVHQDYKLPKDEAHQDYKFPKVETNSFTEEEKIKINQILMDETSEIENIAQESVLNEPCFYPFCDGTILKNKSYLMKHLKQFHENNNMPEESI